MSVCRDCEAETPGRRYKRCFRCRLWSYVRRKGPDECWPWTGAINATGYGFLSLPGRRSGNVLAHRAVFEDATGTVPGDLEVCHRCDNPACCNPEHLFLGTQADNMADMDAKGRRRVGHMYGETNPNAVLTEGEVSQIRSLLKAGTPKIQIARVVGISRRLVQLIASGKAWRHVA